MPPDLEIVAYDPNWPLRFERARDFFRGALGEVAHAIHHIGSTSVPGLASKDRIDLQITLAGAAQVEPLQAALHCAALPLADPNRDHRPAEDTSPESEWEKLYLRGVDLGFAMNVHIRFLGRKNQEYPILFRDFLRCHPNSAAAYGDFKRRLSQVISDRNLYSDLKDPVCDLILHQARDWADRTGWTQPPA